MFVRFRAVRHRLVVDLVATKRTGGKIVSEHIARLGSAALPEPIDAAERIIFWQALKERFRDLAARLGNRVSRDDRRMALAAIHTRIPKPTEAEVQAARVEAARHAVASDELSRDMFANNVKQNRDLIAKCEAKIAEYLPLIDKAQRGIDRKKARLVRLLVGGRVEDDDEATADYLAWQANQRDAEIRAAPRPAARGRRGPQKRPAWRAQAGGASRPSWQRTRSGSTGAKNSPCGPELTH